VKTNEIDDRLIFWRAFHVGSRQMQELDRQVRKERIRCLSRQNGRPRCSDALSLLILWNDFSDAISRKILPCSQEHFLVVPMTGEDIRSVPATLQNGVCNGSHCHLTDGQQIDQVMLQLLLMCRRICSVSIPAGL
jgi:hypothetical protein